MKSNPHVITCGIMVVILSVIAIGIMWPVVFMCLVLLAILGVFYGLIHSLVKDEVSDDY